MPRYGRKTRHVSDQTKRRKQRMYYEARKAKSLQEKLKANHNNNYLENKDAGNQGDIEPICIYDEPDEEELEQRVIEEQNMKEELEEEEMAEEIKEMKKEEKNQELRRQSSSESSEIEIVQAKNFNEIRSSEYEENIDQAIQTVIRNHLSINSVAKSFNLSSSTLRRRIKKFMGIERNKNPENKQEDVFMSIQKRGPGKYLEEHLTKHKHEIFTSVQENPTNEDKISLKEAYEHLKSSIYGLPDEVAHEIDKAIFEAKEENSTEFRLTNFLLTDTQTHSFLGVPKIELLDTLVECTQAFDYEVCKVSVRDKVVLALCKLKTNIAFKNLAVLFDVTEWECRIYFKDTVQYLGYALERSIVWPKRSLMRGAIHKVFELYPNARIYLDCIEFEVEKTDCGICNLLMGGDPPNESLGIKVMVALSAEGQIIFLTKICGGRSSDAEILTESNLFSKLNSTDDIMMNPLTELDIVALCSVHSVGLVRPKFSNASIPDVASYEENLAELKRMIDGIANFNLLTSSKLSLEILPHLNSIITIIYGIGNLSS